MVILIGFVSLNTSPQRATEGIEGHRGIQYILSGPQFFLLWLSVGLYFKLSFRHINSGVQMAALLPA